MDIFNLQLENQIEDKIQALLGNETFMPGLERLKPVYKREIDILQNSCQDIVIVAGTNGKGETVYSTATLLSHKSINNCVWSSPHVKSIRERFAYNQEMISYCELNTLIDQSIEELKSQKLSLSYYEFLFWIFLKWSCQKKPQVLLLEVGMGGRFDAVNLLNPSITTITSISRDHQQILGNSYKKILNEKIGVTRAQTPLITIFELEYLNQETRNFCAKNRVEWIDLNKLLSGQKLNYSQKNRLIASAIVELIEHRSLSALELDHFVDDSKFAQYVARREVVRYKAAKLYFVGSHNLDGVRESCRMLSSEKIDRCLISYSKRELRDLIAMTKLFEELAPVTLSKFSHFKAQDMEIVAQSMKLLLESSWFDWLEQQTNQEQTILIAGSYYFIGEIQRKLDGKLFK